MKQIRNQVLIEKGERLVRSDGAIVELRHSIVVWVLEPAPCPPAQYTPNRDVLGPPNVPEKRGIDGSYE